ncbi:hypothetical protein [Dictyobacter arantiisoli]|uniref:Uncharacterized protein n=1 Tax=Dictyobacter arantiisoli TaxID=2014874 RepID=A0A5A5TDN0_9CHLR|nr:hypothetical protein [Dictyobacter arantiisoli]GCF09512.1 hypothetical protein KDI_30760 [Dictyobacter arantiisoli]
MPFSEHTAGHSTPTGNPYELFTPVLDLTAEDNQLHGDQTSSRSEQNLSSYSFYRPDAVPHTPFDAQRALYQAHGDQTSDPSEQDLSSERPVAHSFYAQQEVQRNLYLYQLREDPPFFEIPDPIPEANNPNERFAGIEDWAFHDNPLTGAYEDPPSSSYQSNQPHGDPTFFEHTPAGGPYDPLTGVYEDHPLTLTGAYEDDPLTDAYGDPISASNQYYQPLHGDPTSGPSEQGIYSEQFAALSFDPQPEAPNALYQLHGDPTFFENTLAASPNEQLAHIEGGVFNAPISEYNPYDQPPHGDPTSSLSGQGSSSNITFRPQNAAPHHPELPQEGQGSSSHRVNNPELELSADAPDAQQATGTAREDYTGRARYRGTILRKYVNNHLLHQLDLKQGTQGTEYPYIPTMRKRKDGSTEEFRTPGTVLGEVPKMLQARRDLGMPHVPNLDYLTGNQEKALRKAAQFEKQGNAYQSDGERVFETPIKAPIADSTRRNQGTRERADILRDYFNNHHFRPLDLKQGTPGTKYPYIPKWRRKKGARVEEFRTPRAVLGEVPKMLQARRDAGMENVPKLTYLTDDEEKALRKAAQFEKQGNAYQSDGE